jgi:acyl-CoA hydrolase
MRLVTAEQLERALGALPAGRPRVVASGNHAVPWVALAAADAAFADYRLWMLNAPLGVPARVGVTHESVFVGAGVRRSPRLDYIPARLSLVPSLFDEACPPDVVLVHCAPPRQGMLSLGAEVNVLPAAIEAARARGALVVAQINRRMPYTFGQSQLSEELFDLGLEVDAPLHAPAAAAILDLHRALGERVASLVPDQATLQIGIGAAPDAAISALRSRRGIRIWSEMISDGVMGLELSGSLDPSQPIIASFAAGSPDFYEWLDGNERVRMLRTEMVNNPSQIATQVAMTSINTALEVDLHGQANASFRGDRVHSGLGGQPDFVVGALHSKGGHAMIALPSWHPRADCSTIVPHLSGPVTSFQHSWVVSEQGEAAIFPRTKREQITQLIESVAHPDARPGLREAAFGMLGVDLRPAAR